MKKKTIKILAIIFPFFLFFQFGYGLVVREPYPSFMMPGFSRIDNNTKTYELKDKEYYIEDDNGNIEKYDISELIQGFSKIALGRVIDLAYFNDGNEKTYNSRQKRYYEIIKSIVGEENYSNHIVSIRHPQMSEEQILRFNTWFFTKIEEKLGKQVSSVKIQRLKIIRSFKKGDILEKEIMDFKYIKNAKKSF